MKADRQAPIGVFDSGGENIIARFFFLKTGFSVRYGDIVSTASCAQRLKGGGTDGGLVFTQDFFGFCFCFGSVQDRLQFFGNGIAYLKLDLLVGGAVAVGSYVKAHDLCSDFLLQAGLAEKIGGSGKDQRCNADGGAGGGPGGGPFSRRVFSGSAFFLAPGRVVCSSSATASRYWNLICWSGAQSPFGLS